MEIQGRTFLVTGGASGLGAATVRQLAQEGANVLITDVDEDAGEELAAGIGEQGPASRAPTLPTKRARRRLSIRAATPSGVYMASSTAPA